MMNSERLSFAPYYLAVSSRSLSMYHARAVILTVLAVCSLVNTLHAGEIDKPRVTEATKKLIDAINSGNTPAITGMLDAQMQQVLPPDKATQFFRGIVTAGGKLKTPGAPAIAGPVATLRVPAEHGAWDFKISLDSSDKISGLLITPAKAAAPAPADRFTKVAKRLIHAINGEHISTIESMLDANMQQTVPLDKAKPFFHNLVTTSGKLKDTVEPTISESTATMRVAAEHGAWDFKFALDDSDKITELHISPAADPAAPTTGNRFTKIVKKLVEAINGDEIAVIEAMLDAQMQQALPREQASPFFRDLIAGGGKLKEAGEPNVADSTAMVEVTAEHAAWDFKITLDAADKISELYITPAASAAKGDSAVVPRSHSPMHLPFRGEWFVFWGGDNEQVNHHVAVKGQRRAADLFIMDHDNNSHKGSGQQNEDYYVYGKEILAAGAGKVVTAIDGVPDNVPGSMNPLCAVGNCVIIDQGQNEFALYAHLQPGSLRVHRGDEVGQGQVLGLCGNSGNSSEPHLHFHVQDSAVLQDGAGITPYFTGVTCRRDDSTLVDAEYTFLKGDRIESIASK
jgi:murein DD-endopeptidase MepM/ murein hydrolase activator NlpD